MMSWLLDHEPVVRLGAFGGIFAVMALWEIGAARRELSAAKGSRWFANIGITVLNTIVIRVLFPSAVVGVALVAAERGWGLFNIVQVPAVISILGSILALDFIIYLQHVIFHAVPLLWRLHMVHHADLDCDVTTGFRFHPLEAVISMPIKFAAVVLLGPPAVAVLIFEVVLSAASVFNHGNVCIPLPLDRVVRWFVVTPDMHRVHHSVDPRETNSNFGFNLSWWDRLLGTYRSQPAEGHEAMAIGLSQFKDGRRQTLLWVLALPFVGGTGSYPMGRRDNA
jgi:sterol desaturase/sphingolipid hydroxylase (fatty acid hydroxylase superfamily)